MHFAYDLILWLMLAAVPALAGFLVWARRRRLALMTRFVQSRLLPQLTVRLSQRQERLRILLLVTATTCLFLALARPQWGYAWQEAKQRGLDIVVAIDTSRSMLATDVQPNRLERARLAALDLLRLARSDRLGLVAFAGSAYLQCPLTLDDDAFRQTLQALDTTIIPQGGTAVTGAIDTALAAFKDENNFKILVLISDGEDHDSGAVAAAGRAAKAGMRIFTLGVGTPAGEVLRIQDDQGASSYVKDGDGNVVKSRLNEPLLQQVATAAGGFYLPLRAPGAIETLYQQGLAPIPKTDLTARRVREYHERYHWPLAAALLLLLLEALLPYAKDRRAPETAAADGGTRRGAPANAATAVLGFSLILGAPAACASPRSALRAYEEGRFKESAGEYQRLHEAKPDDARLQFNAGTAAYRAGDLDAAARAFTNVVRSPDLALQQRGLYNLGNTLYRLGEAQDQPQTKRNAWESAVNSFQAARALNTNDLDAANNLEFVRRKLEELKREQEKQQQQQKQDKQDKSKDDQQDANSQPQSGDQQQPQPNQDQQKPGAPGDPKDPNEKNGSPPKNPEPPPQPEPGRPEQKPPQDRADQGSGQDQQQKDAAEQDAQAAAAGRMTPQQASQLLDTQKGEERAMLFVPIQTNTHPGRVLKDW